MRTCICLVLLFSISACDKEKPLSESEAPIQTDVEYHVFAAKDYSDSYYDNVKAELKLSVAKVNNRTGERTLLWDSTFISQNIRNFPMQTQRLVLGKRFSGYSSKEMLNVSYSIKYNDNGYLSQKAMGEVISIEDKSNKVVEVEL